MAVEIFFMTHFEELCIKYLAHTAFVRKEILFSKPIKYLPVKKDSQSNDRHLWALKLIWVNTSQVPEHSQPLWASCLSHKVQSSLLPSDSEGHGSTPSARIGQVQLRNRNIYMLLSGRCQKRSSNHFCSSQKVFNGLNPPSDLHPLNLHLNLVLGQQVTNNFSNLHFKGRQLFQPCLYLCIQYAMWKGELHSRSEYWLTDSMFSLLLAYVTHLH